MDERLCGLQVARTVRIRPWNPRLTGAMRTTRTRGIHAPILHWLHMRMLCAQKTRQTRASPDGRARPDARR